jgi:hypothetical protein
MDVKYLFIIIFIFVVSCNKKPEYLISQEKLIPLIVDLHLADAIYTSRSIIDVNIEQVDSASYYRKVFERYNVTRSEFDSTMEYLTARPKKIDGIYDEVLERLSKMEAEAAKRRDKEMNIEEQELWTKSTNYLLPQDSGRSTIDFSIPAEPGIYRINVNIRIFPDDETQKPQFISYFWYNDGTKDGRQFNKRIIDLKKTNRLERYAVTKRLINQEDAYLRGSFIHHENEDSSFTKHAVIENISVTYKSLP